MAEQKIIRKNDRNFLPFSIVYNNASINTGFWHPETELYFILSGTAQVILRNQSFEAQAEDVFLINAGEIREIRGSSWEAVVLGFRPDLLPGGVSSQTAQFELCSAGNTYSSRFDYVRFCLARLVALQAKESQAFSSLGIFYGLYSHLIANFPAPPLLLPNPGAQNRERLIKIIQYINEHFRENLSLNETAASFSLSAPYFSSFFKKQSGKTFVEYYNEIRLSHAVGDLLSSSASIESIALQNGFGDTRSFTALFKKTYGSLPNTYRRLHRASYTENISGDEKKQKSHFSDPEQADDRQDNILLKDHPSLDKYNTVFREESDYITALSENPRIIDAGTISFTHPKKRLLHNYRTMIGVGSAKQFMYKEVQDMLRRVQKEVGFHYVKFHGLLSDDMMVYSEDLKGRPHYSFTFIDKALDFLLSIGLRPLCQLSFMPIALSEDPGRMADFYHYNTAPPKDIRKWNGLIDATVRHLISRYGLEEVKSWLFCVWNEPDETVDQFAWNDRKRFFNFYEQTYKAVKAVCKDLVFGTPSMLISIQKDSGWAGEFFQYTIQHDCIPEFLNINYYDNSIFEEDMTDRVRSDKGFSAVERESSFPLTVDPYAFTHFINNIKTLMKKHNMRSVPIYLTEWNLTISHRDLINDTCFKSCHLIKNLLENYDRLESFSYWCLTDFIEELQIAQDLYHGGLGLFTYNGIPKANYSALKLLGKLGDELLEKGDGYFITRQDKRISIILYNYEHYSKLYASGNEVNLQDNDRYAPFEEKNTAQFTFRISDLPYSKASIRNYYVNQFAGSSYDAWARLGSPDNISPEEEQILIQQSEPGLFLQQEDITDGVLTLHAKMAPLEIRLIDIHLS